MTACWIHLEIALIGFLTASIVTSTNSVGNILVPKLISFFLVFFVLGKDLCVMLGWLDGVFAFL